MKKAIQILICLFALNAVCMEEGAPKNVVAEKPFIILATNSLRNAFLTRDLAGERKFFGVIVPYYALYIETASGNNHINEQIFVGPFFDEKFSPIISPDGMLLIAWSRDKSTLYTIDTQSGKAVRSDVLEEKKTCVTFSEDSSIVVMRTDSKDQGETVIETAQKKTWLDKGFAGLMKRVSFPKEIESAHMSNRQIHCFDSGLIAVFNPAGNNFICLPTQNKTTTHFIEKKLEKNSISRIIWGATRSIVAITIPTLTKIIFHDFSCTEKGTGDIEMPMKFDNSVIGCFSPDGFFFACACKTWKNHILIINCKDAALPIPHEVLTTADHSDYISNIDWSTADGLCIQANWREYVPYKQKKREPESPATSFSEPKTTLATIDLVVEDLFPNLHAQ